jgi:dTMP kinase
VAEGRGIFITLEGPDGAGKSTQAQRLVAQINHATGGRQVAATREPGGTAIGELIRGVLLDVRGVERDPLVDALLFNAARAQLVAVELRPLLERGWVVVCDRYTDSTLAYQGYGAGLPLDGLRTLADVATGGLRPDRTILFDLSPEAGLRRRAAGAPSEMTRFESADEHSLAFHERVRDGYLELAAGEPERWRVIAADRDPAVVAADVWKAVADLF